jgi:hypothetical protein
MRSDETPHDSIMSWRKSSACQNEECIEIAAQNGTFVFRNSTQPDGRIYASAEEFEALLKGAKAGDFDDMIR